HTMSKRDWSSDVCSSDLKPVCALSGGEATRISLAVVFIRPSNVIVLDEPTNFIDIQTIEALESFIKHYPGTVVFTSHDQYFVERSEERRVGKEYRSDLQK